MKKIITTTVFILLLVSAHAQKIGETEARQYMEKVWGYLKSNDSISFVKLWLPEDSVWQKNHTPIDGMKLNQSFKRLRNFLAPAMSGNLDIDHIEIGLEDARGTEIRALFKAREHASLGFAFYVAIVNDKWSARAKPGFFAGTR